MNSLSLALVLVLGSLGVGEQVFSSTKQWM